MPRELTVGSLFAGIGGFDLGLERAGMRTVWFCEQDPFCQRVLAKHWPGVPVHGDVRSLVADTGRGSVQRGRGRGEVAGTAGPRQGRSRGAAGNSGATRADVPDALRPELPVPVPYVDILAGGFPCQDLSYAGAGAGIDGERSGLWAEYARLIRELRPRYVVVENVSALLARGLGRVLGDLAACGYDAEWDCIPASAVGAPHRRDRVWLVAYPDGRGGTVADPDGGRREVGPQRNGGPARPGLQAPRGHDAERRGVSGWWESEPDVGRVAHGVPNRVDRLRSLGNALVPQIAEWLGGRILEYEHGR
jgi:DNA (cytosine-5)-methyltransferase 1